MTGNAMRQLDLDAPKDLVQPEDSMPHLNGLNGFALRLASALLDEKPAGSNFVCSPYSAWMPLAALANAVDDAHRPALLKALGMAGISLEELNIAASQVLYDLTAQAWVPFGGHNPMAIANAVFVDRSITPRRDFAQTFLDRYRGSVFSLDFTSPASPDAVNRWASENTQGLVEGIVESFDPDTVVAIANAIHYSGLWKCEFDPEKTRLDVFHAPDGDVTVEFMHLEEDRMRGYADSKIQALSLTLDTWANMLVVKPKDRNAASWLKSLNAEDLNAIFSSSSDKSVKLALPKFEIDSGHIDMAKSLAALGMDLFDPDDPSIDRLV